MSSGMSRLLLWTKIILVVVCTIFISMFAVWIHIPEKYKTTSTTTSTNTTTTTTNPTPTQPP
ncbi:MAG: hypothetical protein ACUZ77_03620 [Candidatus Brocadiales bacterium]